MKWTNKITEGLNNITIKVQEKTIELQKQQVNKQKEQIKTLENLVTLLMTHQGYKKRQIFATLHTGELVDNDIQKI
jgi:uncharacterized protein YigA (DUF484 family)